MSDRRRLMMSPNGEKLYYEPRTGAFYPKKLDITITNQKRLCLAHRYAYCSELEEATLRGYVDLSANWGNNCFDDCPILRKLYVPGFADSNSYIAANCPMLEVVELGSLGHPVSSLYMGAFTGSGKSVTGEKSITVYVADTTAIPLANAPWGLTGAIVIYRSSTTGEIREVPTK